LRSSRTAGTGDQFDWLKFRGGPGLDDRSYEAWLLETHAALPAPTPSRRVLFGSKIPSPGDLGMATSR